MRETLKKICDELGVGYALSPYETAPWTVFDDEKDLTCNAEVRMEGAGDGLEAEILIMRDAPKAGEKPVEQVFILHAGPSVADKWDVKSAIVMGKNDPEQAYDWLGKAVEFFGACVSELKMDKMPDFDELYKKIMERKDRMSDKRGGGGKKSPKIKPAQILNPKQGGM
jgi:hypothetical protein